MGILGPDGRIAREARAARRRGVLFDVGHGCGSFSWASARRALEDDFAPDTISTDIHRYSIDYPVVDLPTTMAKLRHLGMSEAEVLASVTSRAAAALRRDDIGSLAPGARADITILRPGPDTVLRDAEAIGETVVAPWRSVLALVDGIVHDPAAITVPLRPYVAADHEVDCTAPLG